MGGSPNSIFLVLKKGNMHGTTNGIAGAKPPSPNDMFKGVGMKQFHPVNFGPHIGSQRPQFLLDTKQLIVPPASVHGSALGTCRGQPI